MATSASRTAPARDWTFRTPPESATLAMNRTVAERRARGLPVLHLGFGEAGLPVAPALVRRLATAAGANDYRPTTGSAPLRRAAAGFFTRRGLPTEPGQVVVGPGSKPLLYALLQAVPGDVVLPRPSWVSYAGQAALAGKRVGWVPVPDRCGGIPDPDLLGDRLAAMRADGADPRCLVVTTPDNPTGTVAPRDLVEAVCAVCRDQDLMIISDEIYADLAEPGSVTSPAVVLPERTVVTTGMSKSLAAGGWRVGWCRVPAGPWGEALTAALVGIASEVWSSLAAPMEQAAAWALEDPDELVARVDRSRALHRAVASAAHRVLAEQGIDCRPPQAAFYLYPDLGSHRAALARRDITDDRELAAHLLDAGVATLPGSAFGDDPRALRLRLATSLLYGADDREREAALAADDPAALPRVRAALDRLAAVLRDLVGATPG